jgi:CRP/FNR family transcriptional regulator, cyclic AMP receptor protein
MSPLLSKVAKKQKGVISFDPQVFLATVGVAKTITQCPKDYKIFSQGDPSDAVFYIQQGRVKLKVKSKQGKEAVIAILGGGDFLGEACLIGQAFCLATATAIAPSFILRIDKDEMLRVLHEEHTFSDLFIPYVLSRNLRIQEDLVDQLFNSSEQRLARTLLLLAHYGKEGTPETISPEINQETLAGMVGTTRSRVNFFMNKFKKLGFIDYKDGLRVHSSLLNIALHD